VEGAFDGLIGRVGKRKNKRGCPWMEDVAARGGFAKGLKTNSRGLVALPQAPEMPKHGHNTMLCGRLVRRSAMGGTDTAAHPSWQCHRYADTIVVKRLIKDVWNEWCVTPFSMTP
jgi:hypothetical protein